jgi:putative RecB family exonuclease
MTTVYSHSRLSNFETCKKKFQLRYLLEIPAESEGIEAFVGKRVHEILERLYEFVQRDQVPSLRRVIERYHAFFDEHFDAEKIRIVRKGLDVDHYREIGVGCLSTYYRRHYPFDSDETLGIEEHIAFDLDSDGRHRVQGIIDRIVRSRDGVIEIQDYKTGAYVPNQQRLDQDRQLALYQLGLVQRYGEEENFRLVWHYLARGQIRTSTRSPEALQALRENVIALIDEIEATREFPARRGNLCNWCEYKGYCPAFGGELPEHLRPTTPRPSPSKGELL